MADDLIARLQSFLDRLAPEFRATGEADVDRLTAAGVREYPDLFRMAIDPAADQEARLAALWALARLGDDRGVAALLVALDDPAPPVRAAGAHGIADTRAPLARSAVDPLIARLDDDDEDVRRAAAYALGMLGDDRAVEPLIERLAMRDESPAVRGMIAEALADLKSRRAVPALLDALADASPEARYWAAFALGEIGDPRALVRLNSVALSDHAIVPDHGSVGEEAAAAIARIEEIGVTDVVGLVEAGGFRPLQPVGSSSTLRLTTQSARLAQAPESGEMDLSDREGRAVLVRGYPRDEWLFITELVEVGSPLLSAVVQAILGGSAESSGESRLTTDRSRDA